MAHEYIKNKKGVPWAEVHFDSDDGAIENVKLFCDESDSWQSLDMDKFGGRLEQIVQEFVDKEVEEYKDARRGSYEPKEEAR